MSGDQGPDEDDAETDDAETDDAETDDAGTDDAGTDDAGTDDTPEGVPLGGTDSNALSAGLTLVLELNSDNAVARYRARLTGERLGWLVFYTGLTFSRVHQILVDPERGPVVVVGHEVYEVDPDKVTVYRTQMLALDAYFNMDRA